MSISLSRSLDLSLFPSLRYGCECVSQIKLTSNRIIIHLYLLDGAFESPRTNGERPEYECELFFFLSVLFCYRYIFCGIKITNKICFLCVVVIHRLAFYSYVCFIWKRKKNIIIVPAVLATLLQIENHGVVRLGFREGGVCVCNTCVCVRRRESTCFVSPHSHKCHGIFHFDLRTHTHLFVSVEERYNWIQSDGLTICDFDVLRIMWNRKLRRWVVRRTKQKTNKLVVVAVASRV